MVSLFFGRLIRGRDLSLADSDPLSIELCMRLQTEMWCSFQIVAAPEHDDVVNIICNDADIKHGIPVGFETQTAASGR